MTDTPEKKPARLHAVLAVEGDLAGHSKRTLDETRKTFGRGEMFKGYVKTLKMHDENREHEEEAGGDIRALPTTVGERLDFTAKAVIRYLDAYLQKETTNQTAKADIIVDDAEIAKNVPATALLGLEKRLHELRGVFEAVPTLDQGTEWDRAPDQGTHIWKSRNPEVRNKTEKSMSVIELSPATKEHKAQVQGINKDIVVGKITTHSVSGMVTSAQKSVWLGKIDKLIRAVKQARTRANQAEVVECSIGDALFKYILGD